MALRLGVLAVAAALLVAIAVVLASPAAEDKRSEAAGGRRRIRQHAVQPDDGTHSFTGLRSALLVVVVRREHGIRPALAAGFVTTALVVISCGWRRRAAASGLAGGRGCRWLLHRRNDGIVIVARIPEIRRVDAERASEMLRILKTPVLGVVINGITLERKGYGYNEYMASGMSEVS